LVEASHSLCQESWNLSRKKNTPYKCGT
jgi:hypothetical protein